MALDPDTVTRIARLARIRLGEAEQEALAGELNGILAFVEQLNEVDTDGVAPMTSVVAHGLRRRPDQITDGDIPDKVLANAPEHAQGFFAVPKVVE